MKLSVILFAVLSLSGCSKMCAGPEVAATAETAAPKAASTAASTSSIIGGTEVVPGAALTAGGASEAGLALLGPSGAATYGAMEGLAGATAADVGVGSALSTAKTIATVLSPIASLASASAGISAAKGQSAAMASLLNNPPQVAPPVTMPTMGSADTLNSMRSNIQEQMVRRGRASTILTSPSEGNTLGN